NLPNVGAVHVPHTTCGAFMAFISMKKIAEGEPQMAIMAALGTEQYTKYVIVVDDDVDVFNINDVMWAVATRVRAEKDIVFIPGAKGAILDPTSDPERFTLTKMGIDATRPTGRDFAERLAISDDQRARARAILAAAGVKLWPSLALAGRGGSRLRTCVRSGASSSPTSDGLGWRLPVNGPAFRRGDDRIEGETADAERDDRSQHQRSVQQTAGELDQIADAFLRRDELRHDDPADDQGDANLHAAEDIRQRVRHADLPKDLPMRAHEGARHAVNILVDRLETHGRVDRHRKERDQEGQQQARHGSGSEPHDEQGCDGNFWDDLRDHD